MESTMANRNFLFCGALLAGLATPPAIAESKSLPADYFEDMPVVLTASRLKQSAAEAPSAVTVIDHEMIVASGARQLVEVLRLVPSFYVGYTNGNSPVAAYHGLSDAYARRMQVLVDGVSIYSPLYGGVDWAELPITLQDIERIEVVRGPNAVSYGANAFLGVINIITRDPATEPHLQAELNAGGNGIRDMVARLAQQGEDWRYRISLSQRNDNRFPNLPDESRIDVANLRAHYRLNPADELSAQLRSSRGTESEGIYDAWAGDPGAMRSRDVNQNTLQLRWTHAQSADNEFWIQAYHHEHSAREGVAFTLFIQGFPNIPYSINFNYDQTRDDIEFQQLQKLGESLRVVWGGQWRDDGVHSRPFFYTDDWLHSQLSRLFGNLEWRPTDKLAMHGGVMFEHNSMTGGSASPRLAGTYNLYPGQTLRFGISRANRAPTLFEEYTYQAYDTPAALIPLAHGLPLKVTYHSSSSLNDEKILSREIAYVTEIPQWKFSGDVRWFNDQIDSLIYGAATRPVLALLNKKAVDYFNSQQGVHERGFELSGHWRLWSDAQIHANSSFTRIDSEMPDTQQSAPTHTSSLLFSQSFPRDISFSAAYYRVGSMRWQNSPAGLPAYDTLDLRLSKQYRWGDQHVELALVTRNALGSYLDYNLANFERRISFLQLKIAY
jgi:iron complex outermembrane receptor protein